MRFQPALSGTECAPVRLLRFRLPRGVDLPSYVLLLNYTDEGMSNIRYLPQHVIAFRQAVEAMGGSLTSIYLTMGQYDLVAVIEAPSDKDCVSMALALCSLGNFRSTTLKAFGEDELATVVENVPFLEDEVSRVLRELG